MDEKKYLIIGGIATGVMFLCILFLLVRMSIMERRTFSDQQQQEVTKTKGDETKNLTAEEKDRLERRLPVSKSNTA